MITVGVVVFNRAWIIKHMLASVQNQTYPHDKLFVVVVDGKSKDDTVAIAKQVLAESDFAGYTVIVKKSNIPEARNICIQNMKGDFLLFWDSDVIMEPTAIAHSLETLQRENVDMVLPNITEVTVTSADEIEEKWQEWEIKYPRQEKTQIVDWSGTGNLLISKKVLSKVSFDPDYTFLEDRDFSSRATKMGFKILRIRNVIGFDVNSPNQPYSSVYGFDMSLKEALRGIRKKGRLQAEDIRERSSFKKFFWGNKRYLFYAGYVPVICLMVLGVLFQVPLLVLVFPLYFLLYAGFQIWKRGLLTGLNVVMRSFIVGIPTTYSLLYYCTRIVL